MNKSQWKVIESAEESCFYLKIMYENKYFYEQTVNLVRHLEKFMKKNVLKIVTDWLIDPKGRYYLIDVK